MGELADAVLEAGGEVTGVIPEALIEREVPHPGVVDFRVVGSMHERKALMADLSFGFLALPGGFGTLEEFIEVLTWTQLGIHQKPCGLLNVEGYYDSFLDLVDNCVDEGFVHPSNRALILEGSDAEALFDLLESWRPVPLERPADRLQP